MAAGGKGLLDRESGAVSERQLRYALRMAAFASPKGTLDCITAFGRTDIRGDGTVPTLVIHGDSDAIVPFEVSGQRSHELIVDSELVVIEGGPHRINTSHPQEFDEALIRPWDMARQGVRTPARRARLATGAAGPCNCVVDPPVVSDVWLGRMP